MYVSVSANAAQVSAEHPWALERAYMCSVDVSCLCRGIVLPRVCKEYGSRGAEHSLAVAIETVRAVLSQQIYCWPTISKAISNNVASH